MHESGSLERRDTDPGHKEEGRWEPHAMKRKIKQSRWMTPKARSQGEFWASSLTLTLFRWRSWWKKPSPSHCTRREERRRQVSGKGRRGKAAGDAGRLRPHRRGCQCRRGAAVGTAGLRAPALPPLAVPGLAAAGPTL